LRLELGDRSGTIEARMWDQFDVAVKDIGRDDFVKVNARVEIYRNRPQLALLQLRLAKPEEIDLADFLPHTKENVEKLFAQLQEFAASIANPWLNKLVTGIIRIRRSPRSTSAPPLPKSCTMLIWAASSSTS